MQLNSNVRGNVCLMNTRTWAEINLDALKENIENIRNVVDKKTMIMAVVKADAYGHGAVNAAKCLLRNGADRLAVADGDEALELRKAGILADILILGATFKEEIDVLVANDVTLTVFSYDFAKKISESAKKQNKEAKVHIKIDTGMSRIGFVSGVDDPKVAEEILMISKLPNIYVEGIFSHFATADEENQDYTQKQFREFMELCQCVKEMGLDIPIRHIANSAAIMMYPETHLEMVRAGIILYGFYPSEEVDKKRLKLRRVMTVKSRITLIKEISGRGVSYGKEYIAEGKIRVATVPIGYADGYTRLLNNKAKMIANGEPVKVIGRICMDQCMIDVTNVHNINTGDEVIIFGEEIVTADDIAKALGTINYEIVCMVSRRIPRIYLCEGKVVLRVNYLTE